MLKQIILLIVILLVLVSSTNMLYSRTATSAVLVTQECPDDPTMFRKIITEFDENNVRIRRTSIECDGTVHVQNYNENGEPTFDILVGTVPLNGEAYHIFTSTQFGTTITSWNLRGYDQFDSLVYHIGMVNDVVQILYPPPPPVIDNTSINEPKYDKELDSRMLSIFPSPANDFLTVKLNSNLKNGFDLTNCSIVIGNIEGKIIFTKKSADLSNNQEVTIDISEFPKGTYGISVNVEGKNSIGTSFIKK